MNVDLWQNKIYFFEKENEFADPPGRACRAPLLPTYLPPNFPFFFSSFLPKKPNPKEEVYLLFILLLGTSRDPLKCLLGTYFFRCQFSHRFLLIFWRPKAKIIPKNDSQIKRKLSRGIKRKSWKYYKKAKCQNLKNHAPVWARCTFSQSS